MIEPITMPKRSTVELQSHDWQTRQFQYNVRKSSVTVPLMFHKPPAGICKTNRLDAKGLQNPRLVTIQKCQTVLTMTLLFAIGVYFAYQKTHSYIKRLRSQTSPQDSNPHFPRTIRDAFPSIMRKALPTTNSKEDQEHIQHFR